MGAQSLVKVLNWILFKGVMKVKLSPAIHQHYFDQKNANKAEQNGWKRASDPNLPHSLLQC